MKLFWYKRFGRFAVGIDPEAWLAFREGIKKYVGELVVGPFNFKWGLTSDLKHD